MTLPPDTDDTRSIWLANGTLPPGVGTGVAAIAWTTPSASAAARVPPPEKVSTTAALSMVFGALASSVA